MTILRKQKLRKKAVRQEYILRLYIAGKTPNCVTALKNLKKICEENLDNKYEIEQIDLLQLPQLAKEDQIIAIPTVIRKSPKPQLKTIGDLSNTEEVIIGLGLTAKVKPKAS